MPSIALAYSTTDLSSNLTYASVIANATAYKTFTPIEKYTPEAENTTYNPPITMGGRRIEQVLYSHYKYPLLIAGNDFNADSTKLDFLRALWRSQYIYLSYSVSGNWGNFVEVITNGKEFPIKYDQGIIYLPEVTFNFYGVNKI